MVKVSIDGLARSARFIRDVIISITLAVILLSIPRWEGMVEFFASVEVYKMQQFEEAKRGTGT